MKLAVRWGFNNVQIQEGDKWKAMFRTNWGLFEPLVMYFGLTNSPATFQMMMNNIFQDLILSGDIMVYLDDILIANSNLACHHEIVWEVLQQLREHHPFLHPEKCEFEKSTIGYLSVIILHTPSRLPVLLLGPRPRTRRMCSSSLA
jgi:hypothetical protein